MGGPVIEVSALRKTFRGCIRALDGLSLQVPPGVVYGLLGPNGAGKTTLIRILATLLPYDTGTARIAGFDVRTQAREVQTRIGLAGQYAAVDEYLTGRENVEQVGLLYGLTAPVARRRARDVLDRIGLADAANRQVRTYSGGMRRRLDLAASLVGRPSVLFLDEPTTGVDPANRQELWQLIGDLVTGGTTVLLTTQYLEEADRLASRIAVIDRGRIVSEGTTGQLKDRFGGAVVELAVAGADHERALQALGELGARSAVRDATLLVPAPSGTASVREVLRRLDAAAITAHTLSLRKPTLDEVFLALTRQAAGAVR